MTQRTRRLLTWTPPVLITLALVFFWTAFLIFRPVTIADLLFEPDRQIESQIVWQDWRAGGANTASGTFIREGHLRTRFHELTISHGKRTEEGKTEVEPYSVQSKLRAVPITFATLAALAAMSILTAIWTKLVSLMENSTVESGADGKDMRRIAG